jgi:hypothetical protein
MTRRRKGSSSRSITKSPQVMDGAHGRMAPFLVFSFRLLVLCVFEGNLLMLCSGAVFVLGMQGPATLVASILWS